MTEQRFYTINDMTIITNKSIAAIRAHLHRKQFDAVPPPTRLGRRLAWPVELVDEWVRQKTIQAHIESERCLDSNSIAKKRGRPTKAEARAQKRGGYHG